ncbi:hypothetical protein TSOC_011451 [Tetrabaena socialis]|uniref:Uncharacterized protein n=1 Tax=Tetrabaena socialis TaxID=47790 RepID=A0A2J7ZQM4_9CHLO|nr:hypothetical protein TSOC_011451 [Tetrabaena socialis]|eukprot:PNH02561.1 hypothetical protein TSOC_011451 [Tetrabaena socialis]
MSEARAHGASVFSSDDDLTNFLAGLRAKYASLYPQLESLPDGHADSLVSDLFPPTRQANLLDSFIAVSGDGLTRHDAAAAAAPSSTSLAVQQAVAAAEELLHTSSQDPAARQHVLGDMHGAAPNSERAISSSSTATFDVAALSAVSPVARRASSTAIEEHFVGPGPVAGVPRQDNDVADAAFMELASGYSLRTLQPPSSETSATSPTATGVAQDEPRTLLLLHSSPSSATAIMAADASTLGGMPLEGHSHSGRRRPLEPPITATYEEGLLYSGGSGGPAAQCSERPPRLG